LPTIAEFSTPDVVKTSRDVSWKVSVEFPTGADSSVP
jgi:hypothetical protein